MREEQERQKMPKIARLHEILGSNITFSENKYILKLSEDQEFDNLESKRFASENGFPSVEESPLLHAKETLISLDYVNKM